jgi:hypothetical protein
MAKAKEPEDTRMSLWDLVCTTDKASVKPVEYGKRKFTAIDAYSQIRKATEVFGPLGIGWWYEFDIMEDGGNVLADLRLFYVWDDCESKPIRVIGGTQKRDSDDGKKAVTDALTKALSYLGFNADVFLGAFDDNKYAKGGSEGQPVQRQQGAAQAPQNASGDESDGWIFYPNAKWPKPCAVCGEMIAEGEPIDWNKNTKATRHPGGKCGGAAEDIPQHIKDAQNWTPEDDDIPFDPQSDLRGV